MSMLSFKDILSGATAYRAVPSTGQCYLSEKVYEKRAEDLLRKFASVFNKELKLKEFQSRQLENAYKLKDRRIKQLTSRFDYKFAVYAGFSKGFIGKILKIISAIFFDRSVTARMRFIENSFSKIQSHFFNKDSKFQASIQNLGDLRVKYTDKIQSLAQDCLEIHGMDVYKKMPVWHMIHQDRMTTGDHYSKACTVEQAVARLYQRAVTFDPSQGKIETAISQEDPK